MTTAARRKTWLDVIIIGHCQGDDTFVAFRPMEIFRFWRNGEFTFFKRCLQPVYFSWQKKMRWLEPHPLPYQVSRFGEARGHDGVKTCD